MINEIKRFFDDKKQLFYLNVCLNLINYQEYLFEINNHKLIIKFHRVNFQKNFDSPFRSQNFPNVKKIKGIFSSINECYINIQQIISSIDDTHEL